MLHGDVLTCTGRTLAEDLADVPTLDELTAARAARGEAPQNVVWPLAAPYAPAGQHIKILTVRPHPTRFRCHTAARANTAPFGLPLRPSTKKTRSPFSFLARAMRADPRRLSRAARGGAAVTALARAHLSLPPAPRLPAHLGEGSLAPQSAVVKLSGKGLKEFVGTAIVFESEGAAYKGVIDGSVRAGHAMIIRNEGPKGSPGMPEMLSPGAGASYAPRARRGRPRD